MKCEHAKKHFTDFLNDSLDEKTQAEVQEHLAVCSSCKKEWESLNTFWTRLGLLPEEQPAEEMRSRFYSMLEAYKHGLSQTIPAPSWRDILDGWLERWWPRKPAFQFALAVMLLIVGLVIGNVFGVRGPANGEIAQLRDEVHSMRQLVTISLLEKQSASDRLRGVNLSYRIDQPDEQVLTALLDTLNYDPNVNVRLAAVDALYLFHDKKLVKEGLVQSLSQQRSPLVQIALIDLMIEIRERQSIEALKQLVKDNRLNPAVKERAQWGIQQLS